MEGACSGPHVPARDVQGITSRHQSQSGQAGARCHQRPIPNLPTVSVAVQSCPPSPSTIRERWPTARLPINTAPAGKVALLPARAALIPWDSAPCSPAEPANSAHDCEHSARRRSERHCRYPFLSRGCALRPPRPLRERSGQHSSGQPQRAREGARGYPRRIQPLRATTSTPVTPSSPALKSCFRRCMLIRSSSLSYMQLLA